MIIKKLFYIMVIILFSLIYTNANSEIVIGDNVNVRSEPSNNSQILHKLRIGAKVKQIKRSGKKEKIDNNEGEWVYIDTNHVIALTKSNETIKGWVFDYYLSDVLKFKRITKLKLNKCIYDFSIGDSNSHYVFYKDGTFVSTYIGTYPGNNNVEHKTNGTVYQYKRVIFLNGDDQIFYINEDGYLCHTWSYLRDKSECSNCKWE